MSFNDIFNDIDEVIAEPAEVTNAEKNSGLWDTGAKENIWRTNDAAAVDPVWDAAGGCPECPGCDDEECECDPAGDDQVEVPNESEPETEDSGMFGDIF